MLGFRKTTMLEQGKPEKASRKYFGGQFWKILRRTFTLEVSFSKVSDLQSVTFLKIKSTMDAFLGISRNYSLFIISENLLLGISLDFSLFLTLHFIKNMRHQDDILPNRVEVIVQLSAMSLKFLRLRDLQSTAKTLDQAAQITHPQSANWAALRDRITEHHKE